MLCDTVWLLCDTSSKSTHLASTILLLTLTKNRFSASWIPDKTRSYLWQSWWLYGQYYNFTGDLLLRNHANKWWYKFCQVRCNSPKSIVLWFNSSTSENLIIWSYDEKSQISKHYKEAFNDSRHCYITAQVEHTGAFAHIWQSWYRSALICTDALTLHYFANVNFFFQGYQVYLTKLLLVLWTA